MVISAEAMLARNSAVDFLSVCLVVELELPEDTNIMNPFLTKKKPTIQFPNQDILTMIIRLTPSDDESLGNPPFLK